LEKPGRAGSETRAAALGVPLVVQKYGGSSVATTQHLRNVASRVVALKRQGKAMVVVVSAMGKTTDQLISLSREITIRPPRRELDMLLHAGEIISAALLAIAIDDLGEPAVSFTGFQAGMITDASHTEARIQKVEGERIFRELARGRVVVITGFQGITSEQEITTLGRGGSDTSAVAVAVGVGAQFCEILTDVDGVYTADPRIVEKPAKMAWCSYDEMLELASLGAKVLHSRSVEIGRRFDVPILVSSSFADASGTFAPGTWVSSSEKAKELGVMEEVSVRGVAHNKNVAKIALVGVADRPGVAARVFEALAGHDVNILLIVQAEHHGGHNDICFLIGADKLPLVQPELNTLVQEVGGAQVVVNEDVGTISLVGEGVKREPGIAARMFRALAREGINIDLISTSNLMITCVVAKAFVDDAVRAVHREFLE
jgi:aspartate kinase